VLLARFELDSGKPKKNGNGYSVNVCINGAPRNAKSVIYEIHDEGRDALKWVVTNKAAKFRGTSRRSVQRALQAIRKN
jgi:hypothetical protein